MVSPILAECVTSIYQIIDSVQEIKPMRWENWTKLDIFSSMVHRSTAMYKKKADISWEPQVTVKDEKKKWE